MGQANTRVLEEEHLAIGDAVAEVLRRRSDGEDLTGAFDRLHEVIGTHCRNEHDVMNDVGYPHMAQHLSEHADVHRPAKHWVLGSFVWSIYG